MLDGALERLGEQVVRFGGSIDKYIGDNVMAVFGAPIAHEDDPERAVRAALAMQAEMERINEQLPADVAFLLRVGINTGEVLAGRSGRRLHGDRRHGQRRRQAPGGRSAGLGHGRRDDLPRQPRVDLLRRAGAARAEGQGRARPGLGGGSGAGRAPHPAGGAADRDAADRTRRRAANAALADRAARARGPAAPGDHDRPGRGRQVAPASRADRAGGRAGPPARGGDRRVPALRLRASPTGPWRRCCGRSSGSSADEPADSAWKKLRTSVRALLGEDSESEEAERIAATIAIVLGLEAPEGSTRRRCRGPAADARDPLLLDPHPDRADVRAAAAAAGDRGHPLGGRGDARSDRAPGPLGARPAADRLPGSRRAARPPARLGRRSAKRHLDRARTALRRRDQGAGRRALPGQRRRLRPGRQGRAAGGRQPPVRGGDGEPAERARRGPRGAARHRPLGARRTARLAARLRAPPAPVRVGDRTELLGGGPAACLRRGGSRGHRGARLAGAEGAGDRRAQQPARRRTRVRLQARADPRRRLRDAAQGESAAASTSRSAS